MTQTRFDFGSVFAGELLIHVFSIRNDGTAPLTLLDKARDTEGRNGSGDTAPPCVAYARAAMPVLRHLVVPAGAAIAGEPVPT